MADDSGSSGTIGEVKELFALLQTYAKQETVDPVKAAARYLAFGIVGALMMTLGVTFLLMAGLRALQTETGSTFTGSWSWAPYLIMIVGAGITIAIALAAAARGGDET
ncbi:MAG: hypothetical protein AAFZ07_20795 [Actinomycetota bacterium]